MKKKQYFSVCVLFTHKLVKKKQKKSTETIIIFSVAKNRKKIGTTTLAIKRRQQRDFFTFNKQQDKTHLLTGPTN